MVFIACKKRYRLVTPTGSVLAKAIKLWKLAMAKKWSWNPAILLVTTHSPLSTSSQADSID